MITLKTFKEIYLSSGNLKKENDEAFLKWIFANDEVGRGYSGTISATKISTIFNAKDLSYNADYRFYMDYFIQNDNRDYILDNIESDLENCDIHSISKLIKNKLSDCDDLFSKRICVILNKPLEFHTIALVMEWILIASLMQENIKWLESQYMADLFEYIDSDSIVPIQRYNVKAYLKSNNVVSSINKKRFCVEVPRSLFYELRKLLIDNANGTLYIAGETLSDAFSMIDLEKSIIESIVNAVKEGRIKEINIYLMDPSVFKESNINEPPQIIKMTVSNAIEQLSRSLKNMQAHLNIYFLPYLNIDHVVITDSFMLLRTTKLWTIGKDFKGSRLLFSNDNRMIEDDLGEYQAHKKYLEELQKNAVHLNTSMEYELNKSLPLDKSIHREIRNIVYNLKKLNNYSVDLFKVYQSQMTRIAISSFAGDKSHFTFNFNDSVMQNKEDLYNAENLLGDNSQKVLLNYLKTTEVLLNDVVKFFDKREESGAIIIPSLDLGYPNNIMRLAGGFATGMFVHWECGTPIIPIDATVNVCSSSVFKINPSDELINNFVNQIEKLEKKAMKKCGYSFSFLSGNHFLMLATDENGEYYLVLHSSAKEMKESYLGLYPTENNWYSSKQKSLTYNPLKSGERYLRYIKGDDATQFIKTAHNLENYNVEIHKWIAHYLNNNNEMDYSNIKHHYYMPTDSSIAIGTFVEIPGTEVPLFSNVKKPVYLFEISEDNWTYDLGGCKGSVCIVPHGWGQQIESIQNISHDKQGNIVLESDYGRCIDYEIVSTARIDDKVDKKIREFDDCEEFLEKGKNFVKGKITKTLIPKFLYCQQHKGKVRHIYFLRHAQTNNNISHIISGQSDKIDILPNQVISNDIKFDGIIYCSSATRCKSTIKMVRGFQERNVIYADNLLERSLGEMEGMNKDEAMEKYPNYFINGRVRVDACIANGESISSVKERLIPFLETILNPETEEDILICSHNQTLKVLYAMIKGIEITDEYWRNIDFESGEIKLVHSI